MIISTNTSVSQKILRENKFSVNLGVSLNNCTGYAEVGFTGDGGAYKFVFASGKIFDNDGRYFSSYLPNELKNIETNFSGTVYDYSIDNFKILKSGSKQDFYVDKFYIDTVGVELDVSIEAKSKKPTLSLSVPDSFASGSYLTGYLVTNSVSGFSLFSGYFEPFSSFSFVNLPTGIISASSPGLVLMNEASPLLGKAKSQVFFETSAGNYSTTLSVDKIEGPYLNYIFKIINSLNVLDDLSVPRSSINSRRTAGVILDYGYQTNSTSLIPLTFPLDISLSYYSGVTGYYGLITDAQISSGGNGYLSVPTVMFSGGGGVSASGNAILGSTSLDYDSVVGIEMTSFGSGYTSSPIIIFSGGTGIINNKLPTIASGSGLMTFYVKSFTGSFDLLTGEWPSANSYFENSYISGTKYVKTGHLITKNSLINTQINYITSFDNDPLVAKLVISGINNNIIEKYITGIK